MGTDVMHVKSTDTIPKCVA